MSGAKGSAHPPDLIFRFISTSPVPGLLSEKIDDEGRDYEERNEKKQPFMRKTGEGDKNNPGLQHGTNRPT